MSLEVRIAEDRLLLPRRRVKLTGPVDGILLEVHKAYQFRMGLIDDVVSSRHFIFLGVDAESDVVTTCSQLLCQFPGQHTPNRLFRCHNQDLELA
ncbi:MAG: hypothetical protein A3D93_02855 [Acidobacteria bacterium RIFCSPHIGHO2_12_FULL_67_30]|nr:MAG: hypothetical protein A3D93_02855 [Acidobacteria bacterium RIFCSPHIGHO2_12_FULL_67_30]